MATALIALLVIFALTQGAAELLAVFLAVFLARHEVPRPRRPARSSSGWLS